MRARSRKLGLVAVLAWGAGLVVACSWDPSRPFDREAPQVNEALGHYDAGQADAAADLLQDYLTTGACKDGNIGVPLRVHDRVNGSFDLGLAMFKLAEAYGQRFGDEEIDAGPVDPSISGFRSAQIECALRIVRAVADDHGAAVSLRMHARYLEGNLLFLSAAYKEAVSAYDSALELTPAMGDAGPIGATPDGGNTYAPDSIARDAAWNRAVALRRIEDKKNDAGPPDGGSGDGGGESSPDGGQQSPDGGQKSPDGGGGKDDKKDKDKDAGNNDSDKDKDKKNEPPPEPDAGPPQPPPPSRQNQDDRILDQLENAPTVQQQAAKNQVHKGQRIRGMVDK
jgi:hypothetical protein